MQICSELSSPVQSMPIELDPSFPIHAPYLDRLHFSRQHPADHLHYHHSWELGICQQGSGIFYIGSRVFRYSMGDVSIIAPDVVHIAQSDPEAISGWQFLDIDIRRMISGLSSDYDGLADCAYSGIVHPSEVPSLRPLIQSILNEMNQDAPHMREMVRLQVGEIAVLLKRLTSSHAVILPGRLHEVSPAVLYIVNHYAEQISLARLAAMCTKSVSSFRRAFERTMHTSPFEYLYHVRIKAATSLLKTTSLPVMEIAERVGYQTLSSFNRHFKRITGQSPTAVRRDV